MPRTHHYHAAILWTGNRGPGTSFYRSYARTHETTAPGKTAIAGSADTAFRGDADRWNPEELLVASLAQCHLLWYLHLAAVSGIVVTEYSDEPVGTLSEGADGNGRLIEVLLRPTVTELRHDRVSCSSAAHCRDHSRSGSKLVTRRSPVGVSRYPSPACSTIRHSPSSARRRDRTLDEMRPLASRNARKVSGVPA
jgi:organic hydroperoxide reductase OsmC/OhrA